MPSECFKMSGACAIRTTLVDECGRPIEGDCSYFVDDCFTSVSITPEIEDAEESILKNACGEICVLERTCPELKFFNVEIEFAEIDPQQFALLTGQNQYVAYDGTTVIGFGTGQKIVCDSGFALEMWAKIPRAACPPDSPGKCWGYVLMPWIVNAIAGDMTFENDNITFTISGETRADHQWGRGPYDVQEQDAAFTAGPLDPFNKVGIIQSDHRLIQKTCIQPPEPSCGCQPLNIPKPDCTLTLTNDADGDATFTDDETAAAEGDNVEVQIVIDNVGDDDGTVESLILRDNFGMRVDLLTGVVTGAPGVAAISLCQTIPTLPEGGGGTHTCTVTLVNYAPPAGESRTLNATARLKGTTYGFETTCSDRTDLDTTALATVSGGGVSGYLEGPSGSGAASYGAVTNVDCDGGANGGGQGSLRIFGVTSDGGTWSVQDGTVLDGRGNAWDLTDGSQLVGASGALGVSATPTGEASSTNAVVTLDFPTGYAVVVGDTVEGQVTLVHDTSGETTTFDLAEGSVVSCDPA